MSRSDRPFKSYGGKCALARKDFFVARCHLLAALYLNVSRPCATCRIMETRESVQNFAPSPKNQVVFEPRIGLHGGGRSPPPCSRTFASTLVTVQICGLIGLNQVFEPRIGLHGGGRSPPPCSRTFASTLVTVQICGLIIVVDVDLVTLASLSRVKKSGRIQY